MRNDDSTQTRPRRAWRHLSIAVAVLLAGFVGALLTFLPRGTTPGPQSPDMAPAYRALQAKWPDPGMRVARREVPEPGFAGTRRDGSTTLEITVLNPLRIVVVSFTGSAYVDLPDAERKQLTQQVAEVLRTEVPDDLKDASVCLELVREERSGLRYSARGDGPCVAIAPRVVGAHRP